MLVKRIFDLLFATVGLLLLLPLFVAIAIWIKLDSAGPVFFRQVRVGRNGRLFRIHKFRSMTADAPGKGPEITAGADLRITRAGTVLRRWKLDELPQLIDVISGDMSLVGPRPEVPRYVQKYPDDLRARVLSVPPGITDFASLEYRDENTILGRSSDPERDYVEKIMPAKLAYYDRYVRERSLLLDIRLIWRTIWCIVSRS